MLKLLLIALAPLFLSSCLAGAAISVAGDVVEGAVNTTGAVIDAAVPGDDDDDEDDD